jgi:signal transduction histidine kinase/ActR/RegA family two-component response regulator
MLLSAEGRALFRAARTGERIITQDAGEPDRFIAVAPTAHGPSRMGRARLARLGSAWCVLRIRAASAMTGASPHGGARNPGGMWGARAAAGRCAVAMRWAFRRGRAAEANDPAAWFAVRQRLIAISRRQGTAASVAQIAAATAIVFILRGDVADLALAIWLGLMTLVSAYRVLSPLADRALAEGADDAALDRYMSHATTCAGSTGLLWGILPGVLAPLMNLELTTFATSVVLAMAAAAAMANAATPSAGRSFLCCAVLPLALANLFSLSNAMGPALAFVCLLFLGITLWFLNATADTLTGAVVSELRNEQLKRDLQTAVRAAEAANQAKSSFLANMSHEIRTPMNAVLGLTNDVLDGTLADDQRTVIETIRAAGQTLMQLLNDILDLSKIQAGRMTLESAVFSPLALTTEVLTLLRAQATNKDLSLTSSRLPSGSVAAVGDSGRLRQVLMNLVSNAIKFTRDGGVDITLDVTTEAAAHRIVWRVRDTGIGIPADRLPVLFEEFVQADNSITRRFGGTGLGLAISKRLVDQMGGSLTVDSESGVGSVFTITVQLPAGTMPAPASGPADDEGARFEEWLASLPARPRVLVAEDNPANQLVIRRLLQKLGVNVKIVGDGEAAVAAAEDAGFDLILMDMQMPVMDGLTAARELRARSGPPGRIPIVALTANAYPEDIAACREAGMDDFISKPIAAPRLRTAIRDAIARAAAAEPARI